MLTSSQNFRKYTDWSFSSPAIPHPPVHWNSVQTEFSSYVVLYVNQDEQKLVTKGPVFWRFPITAVVFGGHCTELCTSGDLDNEWPKQCTMIITQCQSQSFSFPFLSDLLSNPQKHSFLSFSPCGCRDGSQHLVKSCSAAPRPRSTPIEDVWAPVNAPSTVPGPVRLTVKTQQNFAFLKPPF